MASTVDHRGTECTASSSGASLATERAGILASLASNLPSLKPTEGVDAPPSTSRRHDGYKKHIVERLELLRRLDWLETVASLSGLTAAGPSAPKDPAALDLYHVIAAWSPLDLAYACVTYTGTNSTFNLNVLTVLLRYVSTRRLMSGLGETERHEKSLESQVERQRRPVIYPLTLTSTCLLSPVVCTRIASCRTACRCWQHSR